MSGDRDRRAPGAKRIPFEAMVEVGGSVGPAFEAQAMDVSGTGMHLRTAYLPDVGQPLTCRFDAGPGACVLASGQVVWAQELGRGGEFGLRFTGLDGPSVSALRRILGAGAGDGAPGSAGSGKVRLHIEGLGSPMRARVKEQSRSELMVGSELGFLQVGKELELEDADTGKKRAARIDRVEVEIDRASGIPQLVVALKYAVADGAADQGDLTPRDAMAGAAAMRADDEYGDERADGEELSADGGEDDEVPCDEEPQLAGPGTQASPASREDDDDDDIEAIKSAGDRMKGSIAKGAAKIGPALDAFAKRAKITMALIAAKRFGGKKDDVAIPMRRVTAPPPTGGLHAAGRKVVRDSMPEIELPRPATLGTKASAIVTKIGKKRVVIAGGVVGVAVLALAIGMHSSHPSANANGNAIASAETVGEGASAATGPGAAAGEAAGAALAQSMPSGAGQNATPTAIGAPAGTSLPEVGAETLPPANGSASSDDGSSDGDRTSDRHSGRARHAQVVPFSNGGAVTHGNTLRLKMDGAIEKIEGATQTTGFTVVIPNRRSLEAAAPLAARDARIASIKVTNEPSGAELSVTFKDGVPNYLVRARGDELEIVIAQPGLVAAKTPDSGAAGAVAGRHEHELERTTARKPAKHAPHKR